MLDGISPFVSLGSRIFQQSPVTPDSGVRAGGFQRQANLRINIDLVDVQVVTPNLAAQATFAQVRGSLATVASDFNLSQPGDVDPNFFSNESVAGRIIDFARGFLNEATTAAEYNDIYDQVVAGVEAGFSEARSVLDSRGSLKGPVAETVNEIERLVNASLTRLAETPGGLAPASVTSVILPSERD